MDSSFSSERAERIRELFDEVVDLESEARSSYLARVCGDDFSLRREVEALLEADSDSGEVLRSLDRLDGTTSGATAHTRKPDELIGRTISRYVVESRLGGGGMGEVYRARDTKLDRSVALKFLPRHLHSDERSKTRFIREAKAASALDHVNIGYIHEIDETDDGRLFIAMAFYEGETLKKKIARGKMSIADAIDYSLQVARGLSNVHEAGIVHRDIKPANVMVTTEGVAKVVDFGIAKMGDASLTHSGTTLGTVAYMSPEQVRGEKVDHRADLWSLGAIMYEMVTGHQPFRGDQDHTVIYSIVHHQPVPVNVARSNVPEGLVRVIHRLLEKDPEARYQNAQELADDLDGAAPFSDERIALPPPRHSGDLHGKMPRALRLFGVIAIVLMGAAIITYMVSSGGGDAIDSIAVLPLDNLTGNPENEHVADGMTEALIGKLGQIKGLRRVISRTSVMRFKETDQSLSEIGRALDVAAVVEGSLRAYQDRAQIDVRLIDARTEDRLWEQSFTRPTGDVLALQNEVARAIAEAVEVRMTSTEAERLVESSAVDPRVYDLYLRALQARVDNVPSRDVAMSYFEQAIALDSSFAPAFAGLAIEYALLGGFNVLPGGETKAAQLAEKALALDPSLSEPYVALGLLRETVDWDWVAAEDAFVRAIELNPGDAFAHHELAQLWMRMGRFDEALDEEKRALLLDPLSSRYQSGVGEVYLYARRYDDAIVELERAHELNPVAGTYYLGHAYWQKGDYEKAQEWWAKSEGGFYLEHIEVARARYDAIMGRRERALAAVEEWKDGLSTGRYGLAVSWLIATIYSDLGEKDAALEWLEQAYDARFGFLIHLKIDPTFYSLHAEPRFQALLEKMGLD